MRATLTSPSPLLLFAALSGLLNNPFASAEESPTYSGWTRQWQATFPGSAGSGINTANWNVVTGDNNANNEQQTYTSSNANLQLSGGQTLQIIPLRDASAANGWTSARVESVHTFTPTSGKITRAEAKLRFGGNAASAKQGIWPAFWLLGNSLRTGAQVWPACGELDVLETVDGAATGYGTAHCGVYPGGTCNEPTGIGANVAYSDQSDWSTWRIQWNREASSWQDQVVTWWKDGVKFHSISGSRIGDESVWNSLTASPLYFILNVAVGGDWPGAPNDSTVGGTGSMMEVAYVAQYVSN